MAKKTFMSTVKFIVDALVDMGIEFKDDEHVCPDDTDEMLVSASVVTVNHDRCAKNKSINLIVDAPADRLRLIHRLRQEYGPGTTNPSTVSWYPVPDKVLVVVRTDDVGEVSVTKY